MIEYLEEKLENFQIGFELMGFQKEFKENFPNLLSLNFWVTHYGQSEIIDWTTFSENFPSFIMNTFSFDFNENNMKTLKEIIDISNTVKIEQWTHFYKEFWTFLDSKNNIFLSHENEIVSDFIEP
jgi:hypothetical protein